MKIQLSNGTALPLDMHRVKVVQRIQLRPSGERLEALRKAGFNTFLLRSRDVFIDMLTDSGTNAQSDAQMGASMESDDAYAGSESFYRLADAVKEVLGLSFVLPVHQGRAAEHLLGKHFVKPGSIIPMNQHFTTTKAHLVMNGGEVVEIPTPEALDTQNRFQFKGNIDLAALERVVLEHGKEKIPFVRMEASTNLLGGQPFSLENLKAACDIAHRAGIPVVLDASLIGDNAYMIKQREHECSHMSIAQILREIASLVDIVYLSARKSCASRGGFIATNDRQVFESMAPLVPVYEGFLTYGGISTREIEAIAVGLREMTDGNVAGCSVDMIEHFAMRLRNSGVPIVEPPGALGCHVDARRFLPHVPSEMFPAGALAAALYIASGVRGMERGTVSMDRAPDGTQLISELELLRLAVPRRTFTLSHIEYAADRIAWLYQHRELIGGLQFVVEPPVLRFFLGTMRPVAVGGARQDWDADLAGAFASTFGAEA